MRLTPTERALLGTYGKMDAIVRSVSRIVGYSVDDLIGRSKQKHLTLARWVAMKRCHSAGYSIEEIGRYFNRDYTSVWHGLKRLRQLELEAAE